ncbi:MAG: hypothetical protein V1706_14185 [Pseudomonadota bacterium]
MRSGGTPRIYTSNQDFRRQFDNLRTGDIFIGRLRLKTTEESLLVDLLERGVHFFPSALSQLLCRSKTMQALIYSREMLPHTAVIHDQHGIIETVNRYQKNSITKVVTKHDRKNAGMGILLWRDIEEVFSHSALGSLPFPFVVQPFVENGRDIRVVMLGDYEESYVRSNPHNFRNNLHCGGESIPCRLTRQQHDLCRRVMERGKFPYAHIDLMVQETGETCLAEINLRGGIRGARISPEQYQLEVDKIHKKFLAGICEETIAEAHHRT